MSEAANRPEQLVQLVLALCAAFDKVADESTFAAYEVGLEGVQMDALGTAVARAIRTFRFMPKPAELRDLAISVSKEFGIETKQLEDRRRFDAGKRDHNRRSDNNRLNERLYGERLNAMSEDQIDELAVGTVWQRLDKGFRRAAPKMFRYDMLDMIAKRVEGLE